MILLSVFFPSFAILSLFFQSAVEGMLELSLADWRGWLLVQSIAVLYVVEKPMTLSNDQPCSKAKSWTPGHPSYRATVQDRDLPPT
jgi:hypothetical protein